VESNNVKKPELQLCFQTSDRPKPPPLPNPLPTGALNGPNRTSEPSAAELAREITAEVARLAKREFEAAKTDLRANFSAETIVVSGLSITALATLCTVNLFLVTVVFGLATVFPTSGAALIVSGMTLVITGFIAWLAWSKQMRKLFERTRRALKAELQWAKERLS
jgi:hypothetical protein